MATQCCLSLRASSNPDGSDISVVEGDESIDRRCTMAKAVHKRPQTKKRTVNLIRTRHIIFHFNMKSNGKHKKSQIVECLYHDIVHLRYPGPGLPFWPCLKGYTKLVFVIHTLRLNNSVVLAAIDHKRLTLVL